jgi:hypothetical protein
MTQFDVTAFPALDGLRPPVALTGLQAPRSGSKPDTVAEALAAFPTIAVLQDREVPGRRSCLDWLAVGTFGVFVVDEHGADGDRPVTVRVHSSAGPTGPWTVVANGQDHPRAVSGALVRAARVREVLEGAGLGSTVDVTAVVCFDRASLPPMRRQLRLGNCVVVGLPGLGRLLRTSGQLSRSEVPTVVRVLQEAFPPAAPIAS